MKAINILWISSIAFLVGLLGVLVWFLQLNYAGLIDMIVQSFDRPDLKYILENRFIPREKYSVLRVLCYLTIPISVIFIAFLIIKKKAFYALIQPLFDYVQDHFYRFRRSLQTSSKTNQRVLLGLMIFVLIRSVYYAFDFCIQYDEAWNYNYFLSNNILSPIVGYNNYPLHNLITYAFLSVLPENDFTIRLPVIILGVMSIPFVFVLIKSIFRNEKIALYSTIVFSVLPTVVFYSLLSRGVLFGIFFGLILLYYFGRIQPEKWSKKDIFFASFSGALGCYSMISFPLYVVLIGCSYILFYFSKKSIFNILCFWFLSGIFTICLYAPMILVTGLSPATSSGFNVFDIDLDYYIQQGLNISYNQIGFYYGAYFVLILNLILLFIFKPKAKRVFILLSTLLILLPYLLPVFLQVHLPSRAIGFQAIGYLLTFSLIIEYLMVYFKQNILAILVLCFFIVYNVRDRQNECITATEKFDKTTYQIANTFMNNNAPSYHSLSNDFHYNVPAILYYHKINNKDIKYSTVTKTSQRYLPTQEYNGQYFIQDSSQYAPSNQHQVLHRFESFVLYKTND